MELSDLFSDTSGRFLNYDAYENSQRLAIHNLKHRDLRSFIQNDVTAPGIIRDLSNFTMSQLTGQQVSTIGGTRIVTTGEHWTTGTVASDSTVDYFPTLKVTTIIGTVTTSSDMPALPVDILNDFDGTDFFTVAFPNFPAASINLATSTIKLYDGNGNSRSVALNTSSPAMAAGDTEFRTTLATLRTGLTDFSKITKVEFNFVATAVVTVRVNAIRVIASDWTVAGVDMDTRYGTLRRTPARDGSISALPEFTQPIMWRSDTPASSNDPRPIDAEVATLFTTGSNIQTNSFTLYFREATMDFLTQLDLNGETQAMLDGHEQPDLGDARFNSRFQSDLDPFSQSQLDTISQSDLERTADFLSASWIQFTCQWAPVASPSTVTITDTEGNGYNFAITLSANTSYIFFASVKENTVRATIYNLDASGNVGSQVFDSSQIIDDTAFKRRRGRFGWYASLRDGDARINSIEARTLSFAEYRSSPLKSITPVDGAELFVSTSPNIEQFSYFTPGPYNTATGSAVSRDTARSTSGESWKVTSYGSVYYQGLASNPVSITDLENTEIQFDLFYPADAVLNGITLNASLQGVSDLRTIPLLMPTIIPDQWQRIRILLPTSQATLTGSYKFLLFQTGLSQSSWWVDGATIFSRSVAWDGRSIVDDPWGANDARWTPFRNTLSRSNGGILFPNRGRELQVRGRALRQDASISRVQFTPKYSELGRFITDQSSAKITPTASFTTTALGGGRIRFTNTSTDTDGYVALAQWNFGDGAAAVGNVVEHVYLSGSYTATLTAIDNNGNYGVTSTPVVV
jgi:hypothetical protein